MAGLFATITAGFRNSIENPSTPLAEAYYDETGWGSVIPYRENAAGVRVTRSRALTLPAFWRGVDLVSDIVGKLPVCIYKRAGRGKEPDTSHPLYQLLMYQPNPETTAYRFRKTMEAHRCTAGNAYAFILRNGAGVPLSLHHLDPECTWPVRVDGRLSYVSRIDQQLIPLAYTDVIHVAGLGFDGMVGYSVVHMAAEALGLGLATMEYGARFFRNNAEPRVVIEVPGPMPLEAQTMFLKQWDAIHAGTTNAHKTAIVTNGGKVNSVSISARDAQLIEARKLNIIDISNVIGLPPHKLGDSSRAAYNSLEQENRSLLDDTAEGRLVSYEQEYRAKLLSEREKRADSHLILFDRKALVRPTLNDLANYYQKALAGAPWMTIDQVRLSEDMNPLEGDEGDSLLMPAAFREDQVAAAPSDGEQTGDGTQQADDAGLQTELTLNGAQVDAARQILLDLAAGLIAPEAAIELLVGVGIPRDKAKAMVAAQQKVEKTEQDAEREAAPPPQESPKEQPQDVAYRFLVNRSCRRVAERVAAHAERVSKQPDKFMAWLDRIHADNIAAAVEELRPVLAVCGRDDAQTLASGILNTARQDLLNLSGDVSAKGLVGAVAEWSKRFVGLYAPEHSEAA